MSMHEQGTSNQEPVFDLTELFSFLWQKKLRIIVTALVIIALGAYQISKLPRIYRASSTILLDTNSENFSLPDPIADFAPSDDVQLDTYIEYMHSRQFIDKIVLDLQLTKFDEFRSKSPDADEQRHVNYATSQIQYGLAISRFGDTHLLKISFESRSPKLAALVANKVGPAFFEFLEEMNRKRADEASVWLTDHIAGLQNRLAEAEEAYQGFLRENQVVDIRSHINIANREISNIIQKRSDNQKKIADFERTLEQIEEANGDGNKLMSIPVFLNFPRLLEMANRIATQKQAFAELKERYKFKHPKYIQAETNLEQIILEFENALQQFIGSVNQDYGTLKLRRNTLNKQLEEAREQIAQLAQDEIKLSRLRRDVEATQKLYDAFLVRLQETEILKELGKNEEYAVIDKAPVPTSPAKPRLTLLLAVVVLLATFFSIGFWFVFHIINDRATRFRNILKKLSVPILSEIPRISNRGDNSRSGIIEKGQSHYLFAESIRSLRTALIVSSKQQETRVMLVTGVSNGVGASTLATSLAHAFGKLDKTLLVDADMRDPNMTEIFGLGERQNGLKEFIERKARFSDCIHKVKDTQLSVLPCGDIPSDPMVYISKSRFNSVVEKLSIFYERVIIVAPPLTSYSDALILAKQVESVVVVANVESTDTDDMVEAIQRLQDAGAPSIGVVFNKAKNIRAKIPKQSRFRKTVRKLLSIFRRS